MGGSGLVKISSSVHRELSKKVESGEFTSRKAMVEFALAETFDIRPKKFLVIKK